MCPRNSTRTIAALAILAGLWGHSSASAQTRLPPVSTAPTVTPAQPAPSVATATLPSANPPSAISGGGYATTKAVYDEAISNMGGKPGLLASYQEQQPSADNAAPDRSDDYQDAPGATAYRPLWTVRPMPAYVYEQSYYNTWGLGARPLADYSPPGYEQEREYQDAPGVPIFIPIWPPARPPAAEEGRFVTPGMMPGSFLVPGTNTSFRLRGFVRLALLGDFNPIGSTDSFVPNTIPVPQQTGTNFNASGRMSRFTLESWTPTEFCDWNVHTFIEGDFFNGPAQAAGGGGNPFRLRHAFFDFGYFRFGQQNSVFMDGTNWPSLVDFQGPNSWTNQRQPLARMTLPVGLDGLYWATSIERPFSDITTNGLGSNVQNTPDFATHIRYERDRGHVQAAAIARTIGYQPTGGDVVQHTGVDFSGNVVLHPWAILMGTDPVRDEDPSGLTRSRILLQGTLGQGVGRYIQDLAGQGLDGQVDPLTGQFNLVYATGWNASYENWFNENWLMNFTYSKVDVANTAGQPGTTYDAANYLAASLWWIPITRMSFGIEYIRGQRTNLDGQHAEANRLSGLFQYNF